jgi:hypothetical protein
MPATNYLQVHTLLTFDQTNEVARDDPPLMDQLIERVLSVGTWLTEIDLASFEWQFLAVNRHSLSIAFHRHLPHSAGRARIQQAEHVLYCKTLL